jgi:hypothetical protein
MNSKTRMPSDTPAPSGPPSFADVVDSLQASLRPDEGEYGPAPSLNSGAAAQAPPEPAYVSTNTLSQIYSSTLSSFGLSKPADTPPPRHREPEPPPVAQPSTKPEDIARELNVRRWHTTSDLLDLRRRFALSNHPDRVAPAVREAATARMGIANTLIDDAIKARETRR